MTRHILERVIARTICNRWFSLKKGGMWRITIHHQMILKLLNLIASSKKLSMLRLKTHPMDSHGHVYASRASNEDKTMAVMRCFFFTGCVTNLSTLSSINEQDLIAMFHNQAFHLSLWSKMTRQIKRSHPIVPYLTHVLRWKENSRMFRATKLFRYLNPWIYCVLLLLDSLSHSRSVWKWDFVERIERIRLLNIRFSFSET